MTYEQWLLELEAPIFEIKTVESSRREAEAEMALFWGAKSDLGV